MKSLSLILAAGAALAFTVPAFASPAIDAAIADAGRPAADKALDAERHTADIIAFTGVKQGDVVVDVIPGGGYWTRIFAKVVGPKGRVVAYVPASVADQYGMGASAKKLASEYPNVMAEIVDSPNPKGDVDVIFIRQNYHDFHTTFLGNADMTKVNKSIYDSLKPGGLYIVIDHEAAAGAGPGVSEALHRIEGSQVKAEVTAVGFEFVGESAAARHADDDHTKNVFDKAVQGKTDQFIYKFRKPA
jgi:predicted methyltransferase